MAFIKSAQRLCVAARLIEYGIVWSGQNELLEQIWSWPLYQRNTLSSRLKELKPAGAIMTTGHHKPYTARASHRHVAIPRQPIAADLAAGADTGTPDWTRVTVPTQSTPGKDAGPDSEHKKAGVLPHCGLVDSAALASNSLGQLCTSPLQDLFAWRDGNTFGWSDLAAERWFYRVIRRACRP
ncbi:MAG: hypothetical protein R3F53_15610 [Gammaproteobacteria bacterium]